MWPYPTDSFKPERRRKQGKKEQEKKKETLPRAAEDHLQNLLSHRCTVKLLYKPCSQRLSTLPSTTRLLE